MRPTARDERVLHGLHTHVIPCVSSHAQHREACFQRPSPGLGQDLQVAPRLQAAVKPTIAQGRGQERAMLPHSPCKGILMALPKEPG